MDQCPPSTVEVNGRCIHDTDAAVEGSWCRDDRDCNPKVQPGTCDAPDECRGSRPHSACVKGVCGAMMSTRDDSACSPAVEANACDAYRSVFCTGATKQTPPTCPDSCASDDDCDDNARCNAGHCGTQRDAGTADTGTADAGTTTAPARPTRTGADADAGSDSCPQNADCCESAADCSAKYSAPAMCEQPEQCQGSRLTAVCTDHRCGSVKMPDDSACTEDVVGRRCPDGASDVMCTGAPTQVPPPECSVAMSQPMSPSSSTTGSMMQPSSPPASPPPATAGNGCFEPVLCTGTGEDECAPGFRCVPGGNLGAGRCAPKCFSSVDCLPPYHVCLETAAVCVLDNNGFASKSPAGSTCSGNSACMSDACRGGACCDVGGALDAKPVKCDSTGASCPSGKVCIPERFMGGNKCAPRCKTDADCLISGETCYPEGFCNPSF